MKAIQESDEVLVVAGDDVAMARFCFAGAVVFAAVAVVQLVRLPAALGEESFQGAAAGVAIFLVAGLAVFERSVFVFDRGRRVVRWHRQRAFRRRAGELPFGSITAVAVQRSGSDRGVPSRRIALLAPGQEVPLTVAYQPDTGDARLLLAARIRAFVGLAE